VGSPSTSVAAARATAGLSQAALARAAGISRQSIGAIEAGRHRPTVDAALAIARVLDRPVEELFQPAPAEAASIDGARLPDGSAVLAARIGDCTVYAPASAALASQGWSEPNAFLDAGRPLLLPGADLDGFVLVGCDPAVGSAAALLPKTGPRRLIALAGSTASALSALADARAHAALVHGAPGRLPTPPRGTMRLHLARWRVGVAQRGRRARSLTELCERRVRVVQREPGASSQKALASALDANGVTALAGPVAAGHLEVARRVAEGAPAGVTMEPAALQFGLAFESLEEHVAEIWVDARWRSHPAVDAIADVLRSAPFTSRLRLVGGYDLTGCGSEQQR
jgi:DNA-binding XRE family transcriptional regulator